MLLAGVKGLAQPRCISFVEDDRLRLQNRLLIDMCDRYPELACLRGLIGKRSSHWLKIKVAHTADFEVIGCVPTRSEKAVRALLLGERDHSRLVYKGKVTAGESMEISLVLSRLFRTGTLLLGVWE